MRAWILGLVGAAALFGLPASAHEHGHYRAFRQPHTYLSFGYTYGYPLGYYRFGYSPYGWYSPWGFGPQVGVGVRVGKARRDRDTQDEGTQKALKMYVYPAAGQSQEQMADDRYQCHVWAVDKSGYDPTLGAGKRDDADNYGRAFTACMEGRNYVVK